MVSAKQVDINICIQYSQRAGPVYFMVRSSCVTVDVWCDGGKTSTVQTTHVCTEQKECKKMASCILYNKESMHIKECNTYKKSIFDKKSSLFTISSSCMARRPFPAENLCFARRPYLTRSACESRSP